MDALPIPRRRLPLAAAGLAAAPGLAQAAGAHRFRQGEFEVTVVTDGYISLPARVVAPDATPAELAALLRRLEAEGEVVRARANIPVLRRGAELILIDTGGGRLFGPNDGKLPASLAEAGIDPASVTRVVFTHAHPDHLWGTLDAAGRLRFPNAAYHVGAAEWDFWTDPDFRSRMPEALHGFALGAQRDLGAFRDRAVMTRSGDEIVPGLRALDTAGHTPGHLSFEVSGGEGLLIAGDVATSEIVSFEHPRWHFGNDQDGERAIATRTRLLDRAATDRTKLLGYHWAFPGLGFAERAGPAFRFIPA